MLKQSLVGPVFQALADPTRRALLELLTRGPRSLSALVEPLEISLAAVVQHVQTLEACELVASEKVGRVRSVRLNSPGLRAAEAWLASRRTLAERRLDALDALLAEVPPTPRKKR